MIRRAATRARLRPERVGAVLQSPLGFVDSLANPAGVARTTEALSDLLLPLLRDVLIDVGIPASYGDYTPSRVSPATADQLTAAQRLLVAALWMPDGIENGEVVKSLRRVVLGIVPNTAGTSPGLLMATTGALAFSTQTPQWQGKLQCGRSAARGGDLGQRLRARRPHRYRFDPQFHRLVRRARIPTRRCLRSRSAPTTASGCPPAACASKRGCG